MVGRPGKLVRASSMALLPLASADEARVVLHIGTFSKVFAPGLRLGYAVGQGPLIEKMAAIRSFLTVKVTT